MPYQKKLPQYEAAQYTDPNDTSNLSALGCMIVTANDEVCLRDEGDQLNFPIPLNGWITKSDTARFEIWTDSQFALIFEESD